MPLMLKKKRTSFEASNTERTSQDWQLSEKLSNTVLPVIFTHLSK